MSLVQSIQALPLQLPSPLQKLESANLAKKKIEFYVKRDDLIHPLLSGNKWRKLKYNLFEADKQGKDIVLSFGGAYSNHIHALAAAGDLLNFKTIGIIRGERSKDLSPTLQFAERHGMQLHFISRQQYRAKQDPEFISELYNRYGNIYLLPEGGSNQFALKGCAEIVSELDRQLNVSNYVLATAVGSGGTIAGLLTKVVSQAVLGVTVLKGAEFLQNDIKRLLGKEPHNLELFLNYHFGGYAKTDEKLLAFVTEFKQIYGISLEPVYTGKLFFALFDLIEKDHFAPGTLLVALHTGGLQGLSGFKELL